MDISLDDLQPQEFFRWFFQICRIPHGSGNEAGLIEFLQAFASCRNIPCYTDPMGNILMTLPATAGYEAQPSVLFQAHMDMICEKDPGVEFDFTKDPIRLRIDGDKLMADGTTLGADNAVGVATMLALADSDKIPHPPLELLFTVKEEVGLVGIRNFDMGLIKSRRMVNMDCGDSHVLCVSSAGRISAKIRKTYTQTPLTADDTVLSLTISGGQGGHAGLCANKGRACASNVLGELLSVFPVRLISITGTKPIMKTATARIAVKTQQAEAIAAALTDRMAQIRSVYQRTDPDICLTITPDTGDSALSESDSHRVAMLLNLLRTGQSRADGLDHSIIISSSAVISLSLTDGNFSMNYMLRSQYTADQELHFERACFLAESCGMELVRTDGYAGWPEKTDSPFRDKFQSVHKRLFGTEMELERCPGGIETGIVCHALPDIDAVGVAPTARGAHTTKEHLFISETAPYWELIKAVLAEKDS